MADNQTRIVNILLIYNDQAGNADRIADCEAALANAGLRVQRFGGEAEKADQPNADIAANFDAIVVAGGDGTLNYHLQRLVDIGLPVGVMPLGTANDFAHAVNVQEDLEQAAAVIAHGQTRVIDVGSVNGTLFVNALHLGAGEYVAQEMSALEKMLIGKGAYFLSLIRVLKRVKPFSINITINGKTRRRKVISASVCNGQQFGGGISVTDNSLNDGKLTCFYVTPMRWYRLLGLSSKVLARRFGADVNPEDLPGLHVFDAESLQVATDSPLAISVDGDTKQETPAKMHVIAAALTIIRAPADNEWRNSNMDNDTRVALNEVIKQALFVRDLYEKLHEPLVKHGLLPADIAERQILIEEIMQGMRREGCLPAMPDTDLEVVDRIGIEIKRLFSSDKQTYRDYFVAQEEALGHHLRAALQCPVHDDILKMMQNATSHTEAILRHING